MQCLVTGVAGFVGSSLADKLLALGHSVRGIDCFTDYYPRSFKENNLREALKHPKFQFTEKSIVDADLPSLLSGVDWIFHQAGQPGVRASWGALFDSYTTNNIIATQRLLEASLKSPTLKKFVNASSSSVYGDAESFPTSEKMLPRPVSPYGVTKLAAEHLARLYATEYGVPTVSLRYFTVFGPRQRPDMAFHRFIRAALAGEELSLFGDGEQSRDFTFIDDIVAVNILAAEKGGAGEVFNVGGGSVITVNETLEIIQSLTGTLRINRSERQRGDARHTSADTSHLKAKLGFSPKVSVRDGIAREVEWFKRELMR